MDVSGGLSLVQTVLQLLSSPIWTEIESAFGVKSDLEKLKVTMSTIQNILLDAEEHLICPTHVDRGRLERLKEVLYQADDLFDEVTTLALRKKLEPGTRFFSYLTLLRSAFTWSGEIKKIREKLGDIKNDYELNFGLTRHSVDNRVRHNPRETHSFVGEVNDDIIGRDDDKRKVMDMLSNDSVEENVSIVSIVGIGGLGKTTLAQFVYNDEGIQSEFPLKMWVCVSDDFDVRVLLGKILVAATKETAGRDGLDMDQLQMKLRQQLDGKKYLLVLDDVWNQDPIKWDELRKLLSVGGKGSRIIVTTRLFTVANIVKSHHTHELKGLSEEASWNLFERMALETGQHQMQAHLVDIGKEIVRKCAYVPLFIKVAGSFLQGQDESQWIYLNNTDLAGIKQDDMNGIVPVLKISYNHLPFYLKSCFSYCAVFPKDSKIIKEDLIHLWMAQGFILPLDGKSFEDVGDMYFERLLQRCFFQGVELAKGTGERISFKMHDLIHDLAKEVAGTEIWLSNCSTRCFNDNPRHLYIDISSPPEDLLGIYTKKRRIRTILFERRSLIKRSLKMKHLRALILCNVYFGGRKILSSLIGKMLHLRYLDLSHNSSLLVLPSSITNLYNLQTLKLYKCSKLKRLPRDLRKLVNLRRLDIYGCSSLTCMPPGMGSMTSLQNLTRFVVGGTSNPSYRGSAAPVGELVSLKSFTSHSEVLEISVEEGVKYNAVEGREGGFLSESQKLREIRYSWNISESDGSDDNVNEALLQSLQPHSYLRRLELLRYPCLGLPFWMMNLKTCLPKVVQLDICGCKRLEHLPLMSPLRYLKFLILKELNEVEYVESCSSNVISGDDGELIFFPALEKLKLIDMQMLKGLWKSLSSESRERETPQARKLSHLKISRCSNLTTLFPGQEFNGALSPSINLTSCVPNLVQIEIVGCQKLEHLPLMSQLLHLKVLKLSDLSEVEYMENNNNSEDEDGDELVFFPSLEVLKLWNMPKLKGWWKSSSESRKGETPEVAVLSYLVIFDCPELTTFPLCPKLESLKLVNYNEALGPIMRQTNHDLSSSSSHCKNNNGQKNKKQHQEEQGQQGGILKAVVIDDVGYLSSLPFHSCLHFNLYKNKRESLNIREIVMLCRSGRLSSIGSLDIDDCSKLKSISAGRGVWEHFTALETLSLQFLPQLELEDEDDVSNSSTNKSTEEGSSAAEMPWRYLAPTLRSLTLCLLPKVVKLPKGIERLSFLHSLEIWGCYNLESLTPSIGGLSSLQSLEIHGCRKLKTMPEEMRHLTSLTILYIRECRPELKKRCEKHTGIYWPYIQHIPNITVNSDPDLNPRRKNCFGQ